MPRPSQDNSKQKSVDQAPTLGRKILGWSNNLLASGLILALGLTFGYQAIAMWRSGGSSDSDEPPRSARSTADQVTAWDFGAQAGRWTRTEFLGTRSELIDALASATASELIAIPESSDPSFAPKNQSNRGQNFVRQLGRQRPVWSDEHHRRVYVQDGPLPMAVGCTDTGSGSPQQKASGDQLTVHCWSIALPGHRLMDPSVESSLNQNPSGGGIEDRVVDLDDPNHQEATERTWTLIVYRPDQAGMTSDTSTQDLPASVDVLFSVTDDAGRTMTHFRTDFSPQGIQERIAEHWKQASYQAIQWSIAEQRCWGSARRPDGESVEVDLAADENGTTGLLIQ